MTMIGTAEGTDTPAQEPRYAVYPEAFEVTGRSLQLTLGDRLCEAAMRKLKDPKAWKTMSYKELSKLLRDNCIGQDGYLSPQQPVLETAFRILLTAPDGSLTLEEIHSRIAELWMTSPWPRHISREALKRVLDNGHSYGIAPAG